MRNTEDNKANDNRANQLNPTHSAYHRSRGASEAEGQELARTQPSVVDNRANQLNPNNPAHHSSRGGKDSK